MAALRGMYPPKNPIATYDRHYRTDRNQHQVEYPDPTDMGLDAMSSR
jgi:hypothetical protein